MASPCITQYGALTGDLAVIAKDDGCRIGTLEVITAQHIRDSILLERLCDWHNRSLRHYFDQTEWQPHSTARWLTETVISSDSRLLFLINDDRGAKVGFCGLSKINGTQADVYDIVRGEAGGHARLLPYAQITMLRLAFYGMQLQTIYGAVHPHNIAARRLGRFVGFEEYEYTDATRQHVLADLADQSEPLAPSPAAGRKLLLRITRDRFAHRHPTLGCLPEFDSQLTALN